MYLDFFKFKKNPFHITPDPDFLFLSPSHKEASASIFYGIEKRKGFVAVTGEVGVGKTTILRTYLEGTDPEKIRIVYIFNAALSFDKLLKQIVSELGIQTSNGDSSELVDSLFQYLIDEYENDRNVVLIIDEAQNMPVETLERLRMLSNLETSQDKLLQIILVGQPEFEDKLNLSELRQLKQRIAIRCRIEALEPDDSLAYIHHRLMKASQFHNPVFTKKALKRIVKEANGIPRVINILCDNALVTAFGYQRKPVDEKIVKEVIKDFKGGQRRISSYWKIILVPALVACLVLIAFVSRGLLPPREIPAVGQRAIRGKVPELPPAAETARRPEAVRHPESPGRARTAPAVAGVKPPAGTAALSKPAPAGPPARPPAEAVSRAKTGPDVAEVQPVADSLPKAVSAPAVPKAHAAEGDKSVSRKIAPQNTAVSTEPSAQPVSAIPAKGPPAKKISPSLVVKRGDNVSRLLMDVYGRVDENLLRSFMELNPQVKNINRISVGEKIVLPQAQPAIP